MINFEKRANSYTINFETSTVVLTKYYKNLFDIDIDPESPLILIKSKGKNEQNTGRYFPPQLCLMVGLTDGMLNDFDLMKNIARLTKQEPSDKVNSINDIVKLMNETKGIAKVNKQNGEQYILKSSFEKKEEYGIEICDANGRTKGKENKSQAQILTPTSKLTSTPTSNNIAEKVPKVNENLKVSEKKINNNNNLNSILNSANKPPKNKTENKNPNLNSATKSKNPEKITEKIPEKIVEKNVVFEPKKIQFHRLL